MIKSGGVEIRGLKASAIPRKKPLGEPVLEKYKFIQNEGSKVSCFIEISRRYLTNSEKTHNLFTNKRWVGFYKTAGVTEFKDVHHINLIHGNVILLLITYVRVTSDLRADGRLKSDLLLCYFLIFRIWIWQKLFAYARTSLSRMFPTSR